MLRQAQTCGRDMRGIIRARYEWAGLLGKADVPAAMPAFIMPPPALGSSTCTCNPSGPLMPVLSRILLVDSTARFPEHARDVERPHGSTGSDKG